MIPILEERLIIGNRIPRDFFVAKGRGESDLAFHAGSYHLALKAAGIECYNHLAYSSILPAIAQEVKKPSHYLHGSVAESIEARADAPQGELATAGIVYGWLIDKSTENKYGGLVCEYHGKATLPDAEQSLQASLQEIYQNGFSVQYHLRGIKFIGESFTPQKKCGTALVSLVFVNYVYPLLGQEKK